MLLRPSAAVAGLPFGAPRRVLETPRLSSHYLPSEQTLSGSGSLCSGKRSPSPWLAGFFPAGDTKGATSSQSMRFGPRGRCDTNNDNDTTNATLERLLPAKRRVDTSRAFRVIPTETPLFTPNEETEGQLVQGHGVSIQGDGAFTCRSVSLQSRCSGHHSRSNDMVCPFDSGQQRSTA